MFNLMTLYIDDAAVLSAPDLSYRYLEDNEGGNYQTANSSGLIQLTANQTVTPYIRVVDDTSVNLRDGARFFGYLVGQENKMSISQALTELGITEWVLRGEPTTEDEFNEMFRKVTGADSNGSAIESSKPSDWGTTWSAVKAKADELKAAEPMRLLREERNRLIAETDWWASSDLAGSMSGARTAYREALRDITKSATSLDDVTWPTKPE